MGGNAFGSILKASSFPRLPPAVYAALKSRLLPKIQELYSCVAVPIEAPDKPDYGDLDFVVSCPKVEFNGTSDIVLVNLPHEIVQQTIGARFVNPVDGNRTSNFAIPVAVGEWALLGHQMEEEEKRRDADEIFYQVDVNVCTDKAEWERIVFFHGYGDLGMILGLIAKNAGLALGEKGLKFPDPPHPPVELSQSFDEILGYMGLGMETWKAGFKTRREVFEWAGSSRFFNPTRFRPHGEGIRKVKAERKMYAEFVEWAMEKAGAAESSAHKVPESTEMRQERELKLRNEALVFFKRKEAFDATVRERLLRARVKEVFRGSTVRDWTDLGEHWKGVKIVMDGVRERVGGEEGVMRILEAEGEEGVKNIVLDIKEELSVAIDQSREKKLQNADDLEAAFAVMSAK